MTVFTLCNNVNMSVFETEKFNSVGMSVSFILPATQYNATGNNILAGLFFEGCGAYRNSGDIYSHLEEIFAQAHSTVVKKGDYNILVLYFKFRAEYIKEVFNFAENMIFEPVLCASAVERQVKATGDRIKSEKNDKRAYARNRLIEYAFRNQPFGTDGNGSEKYLNMDIKEYYDYVISKSKIEIMVVGNIKGEEIKKLGSGCFHFEPREDIKIQEDNRKGEYHYYCEKGKTEQNKLCIGVNAEFESWEKAAVANCIIGGGGGSLLFKKVREEQGLCYYIVSSLYRYKEFMVIESAINSQEKENVLKGVKETLENFSPTKEGTEKAKRYIINSLKTAGDYQSRIMDFYLGQALAKDTRTIEDVISDTEKIVNMDNAFKNLNINTVFSLESESYA